MILSATDIIEEMDNGRIIIDPFDKKQLNPNSYNLRLGRELLFYQSESFPVILDSKLPNLTASIDLDHYGFTLLPGTLYLGSTVEHTETYDFVPMIEGRSSIARLGVTIHASAGFGDNGFRGCWTLELSVVHPVRIYPGMEICQISYYQLRTPGRRYAGKYQDARGPETSKMFRDWE